MIYIETYSDVEAIVARSGPKSDQTFDTKTQRPLCTPTSDHEVQRKKDILFRATLNPGMDACEIARALGIPELEAVVLVQDMLRSGLLDFSD